MLGAHPGGDSGGSPRASAASEMDESTGQETPGVLSADGSPFARLGALAGSGASMVWEAFVPAPSSGTGSAAASGVGSDAAGQQPTQLLQLAGAAQGADSSSAASPTVGVRADMPASPDRADPSGPPAGAALGATGAGGRSESAGGTSEVTPAPEGCSAVGVVVSPSADAQAALALGLGLNPSPSPDPALTLGFGPAEAGSGGGDARPPRTPRSAVRRREASLQEGGQAAIGRPLRVATPARCAPRVMPHHAATLSHVWM